MEWERPKTYLNQRTMTKTARLRRCGRNNKGWPHNLPFLNPEKHILDDWAEGSELLKQATSLLKEDEYCPT